jgi:hypothetical protein
MGNEEELKVKAGITVSDKETQPKSPEKKWQILKRHQAVIYWSIFMGLAGINWGLDVMVSQAKSRVATALIQ